MSNLVRQVNAELIPNIPSGGVAAANVQAAINELDAEKANAANLAAPNGSFLIGNGSRSLNEALNIKLDNHTAAQIKAKTYNIGEIFRSGLYGGSTWEIKTEVILQDLENSNINYDDELHLIVNKIGGGTAVAECQTSSVAEYAKELCTKNYIQAFARLRQTSRGTWLNIACYGDSITFGQYTTFPGAVVKTGTPTGFGDGSLYEHDQHPNPWPAVLQDSLREVYGSSISVTNRGYSGDRVGSGYNRHRSGAGEQVCFVGYGTNDVLYCTANGTVPERLFVDASSYALSKFVPALRKFVIRQMLRGSVPILVAPYAFISQAGYDGTQYSSAKILDYYRNAIYALGHELGVLVMDMNDIIGNLTLSVLVDGVHPATEGHNAIGRRMCAPLIGRGYKNPERISGERRLTASILTDSVEGNGAAEIINTSNASTFGKPFYSLSAGQDLIIGAAGVFWSFYLEEDSKHLMPIGCLSADSTVTYILDFDDAGYQPEKLRVDPLGVRGQFLATRSFKTIATGATRDFNHPAVLSDHVVIMGKGWHTVKVIASSGSFIASGLRFWDEPTYWSALQFTAGMSQYGEIAPAWAIKDSTLIFRGSVISPNPLARLRMFNIPWQVDQLLPANIPATSKALTWTPVQISLQDLGLYWDANIGTSTNTLNLENIKIPLGSLP